MPNGPNVTKLIVHKMSLDAITDGGGLASAIQFLSDPQAIKLRAESAGQWVGLTIRAVRNAPEPNPWKSADDEAIAGEILRHVEEKKKRQKGKK